METVGVSLIFPESDLRKRFHNKFISDFFKCVVFFPHYHSCDLIFQILNTTKSKCQMKIAHMEMKLFETQRKEIIKQKPNIYWYNTVPRE